MRAQTTSHSPKKRHWTPRIHSRVTEHILGCKQQMLSRVHAARGVQFYTKALGSGVVEALVCANEAAATQQQQNRGQKEAFECMQTERRCVYVCDEHS